MTNCSTVNAHADTTNHSITLDRLISQPSQTSCRVQVCGIVGFNIHVTHYQSFWGWCYWSDDSTDNVTAVKNNVSRPHQGPIIPASATAKLKKCNKFFKNIYSTIKIEDTKVTEDSQITYISRSRMTLFNIK